MSDQFKLSRSTLIIILVILAILAIVMRVVPGPRNVDDSFITFRYARNIVAGEGFVYNLGVRTLGTTTPLYTLLMASIETVVRQGAFPTYALIVNALADAITVCLLFILVYRLTESIYPGLLMGGLWAIAPISVTFAIGGMETSVIILWMVAATTAFVFDRRWLVGVFAALGLLTRPDAAIWILPLGLYQVIEAFVRREGTLAQRIPWQTWVGGALTLAPWAIFATWYFGSPLSNSLSAKSVAYHVEEFGALINLLQRYATPFMDFDTFGPTGAMVGAVLYTLLNLFALLYVPRHLGRLMPFLVYPWLYFIIFSAANPLMFRWYYAPPMPAWILGVVVGMWSIIGPIGERTRRDIVYPLATVMLALWWGGLSLNAWTLTPDHGPTRPAPEMAWHELELHYREVGELLRDTYGVTAASRVASADIGAVGYYSGATIIDTVGLVTPELSAYYPFDDALRVQEPDPDPQNYAIPPALILDTQPEYFVTMEGFIRKGLAQMPEFTNNYTLIYDIPTGYYGEGVYVYGRNDVLDN